MKLHTLIVLFSLCFMMLADSVDAGGSKKKDPAPEPGVKAYNAGTDLLSELKFTAAEKQLRQALQENEKFPEAHNNLAYALRKQGPDHYKEALRHYNRAIELDRNLDEAYMYRGVLYVQMGQIDQAQADLEILRKKSPHLAQELNYVVENKTEKTPEQFFGVAATIEE